MSFILLDAAQVSPNNTPFSNNAAPPTFLSLPKHIPESQCLITRAGNDDGTIGTHAKIQHTISVSRETNDLLH